MIVRVWLGLLLFLYGDHRISLDENLVVGLVIVPYWLFPTLISHLILGILSLG